MIETLYQRIDDELYKRFQRIKLVLSDVDGVLSDGKIYMTAYGDEIKSFNAKDGCGIVSLSSCGVEFGVITGRASPLVEKRMKSLGVRYICQGVRDKYGEFVRISQEMGIGADECLYIGDDVIDLPLMRTVGIGVAVRDAHPLVLREADFVTVNNGGNGAVREVTDLILQCHDRLDHKEISQ
jgi:3-deoxy-D-manno-octulosonate 8-phosphate phosphatase (KDO 8-P phosphatase)